MDKITKGVAKTSKKYKKISTHSRLLSSDSLCIREKPHIIGANDEITNTPPRTWSRDKLSSKVSILSKVITRARDKRGSTASQFGIERSRKLNFGRRFFFLFTLIIWAILKLAILPNIFTAIPIPTAYFIKGERYIGLFKSKPWKFLRASA